MKLKIRDRLRTRLGTYAPLKLAIVAVVLGLLIGAGGLAATATALAWTNTEQFCIGCHEMKNNVYAEYKGTIHDTNRTGVRAICSDCHVPKEIGPKLVRKVHATWELYGAMIGKINTKEKFEAHRHEMAVRVWTSMKETDSRECRNCHTRDAMSKDLQSQKAQARHATAVKDGKTCVECHFGIAHKEPDGPGPKELFSTSKQAPAP
ncbi:MAG TPA: NapC/NirT family cytochrome c [Ramlibacter sp.]|nr:NapC/NirT family cytochrome c [Ramlibacter sp.]